MRFNLSEINECIRTRRSIYPVQFSNRKVHKELIEILLENARWAPTHKLTQPWRFKIFYDQGADSFGKLHAERYKEVMSEKDFNPVTYRKLRENAEKSSAVIAIMMKRDEKESIPEIEEIASVAASVENMYITCSAYGLAGYWSTGGLTYTDEMKQILGLGEKDRCMGFFYLGYPDVEWPKKTKRMQRQKISEWVEE